ncbi:MAG: tRNA epoxyqueuosine(34) reductase QueG [Rhodospirillales bacterium]|nr:tRNA epoxyqueuosine(34) reductase QueG [Alphaproteobacteria bacterium]MBL6948036.1 tRNA epoxyqueuosine(34) reductase QueG [Rhodospirillales bacterium]
MSDEANRDLKTIIREHANALGFDAVGFASAAADPADTRALDRFLNQGRQGDMAWLDNADGRRGNPKALMPDAQTIIMLGANYGPPGGVTPVSEDRGAISVYARGRDYHDVLKKKMKQLARWLSETHDCGVKVFVDTAPVMEKPLAGRAGIGWQGKHTNLVSRDFGSWLFLAEIFTTLDLPPDRPEPDHCGHCDRCIRACPTDALPEPYQIDPRRCVSYLTIEHKGPIAPELMAHMGNRVYGCDDCLAACPWTKFQQPATLEAFQGRAELAMPKLADLAALDDAGFRKFFSGSPIKRTGRERFVRNVLIAIGNSGDKDLLDTAAALTDDSSPLVAEAAAWAAEQLGSKQG